MYSFAELLFWVVCHVTCIVSPNGLCIPLMHTRDCIHALAFSFCLFRLLLTAFLVLSCMPSVCFFYDLACIEHLFTLNCCSLIWTFTYKVMTSTVNFREQFSDLWKHFCLTCPIFTNGLCIISPSGFFIPSTHVWLCMPLLLHRLSKCIVYSYCFFNMQQSASYISMHS